MTMTTQIPTCPTRRSFPQVYIFRCTIELWPRSHQQEATPCEMFTVFNQYQIKQDWICGNYTMLRMYLQSLDEAVQLVTQRARVVLHDSLETARRALLHQQGQFLAATPQYEAAARPNLVITLASNSDVHNCNVQIQVRQLEQEADALLSQRQKGSVFAIFSGGKSSSWISARKLGDGSDLRSMETRPASVRFTYRTQSSSTTLDVTQHICQEYAGLHQHLTGLVLETQQYRDKSECGAARSATGPETIEAKVWREVWQQNNARARFETVFLRNGTNLESCVSWTSENQQIIRALRSEVVQLKASAVPSSVTRNLEAKIWKSKIWDSRSAQRSTDNTRFTEQLGRSKRQFDSRCLCWERPENWFQKWTLSFFAISQSRYALDWWGWGC